MATVQINYTIGGDETSTDAQLTFNIYNYGVLFRVMTPSSTGLSIAGGVATIDLEVSQGTAYSFTIAEVDGAGNVGPASNVGTVTTATSFKAIMTNFRVQNATPTLVHFDTPLGSVAGININNFFIEGRTITGVDTTSNYFTLSAPLTYWETILIRKEGGNNSVVYDFRLQEVVNNISEPSTSRVRYVEVGATGSGLLGDPMSIESAFTESADNTVYHIKKGTYNAVNCVIGRSASLTAPAKFIGYDTTPLDSPTLTRSVGMAFDANVMPLLDGGSSSNWAIRCDSKSGIIFKNLQIQSYDGSGGISGSNANGIVIDNLYLKDGNRGIELDQSVSSDIGGNCKVINSYIADVWGVGVRVQNKSNLIKNTWVVSSKIISMDYYIAMYSGDGGGVNQLVKDCYVHRFGSDTHGGHGIDFRSNETGTLTYSLAEDCEVVNLGQAVSFRHTLVQNNVARGITATAPDSLGNLVTFRDDASYNVVENSIGTGLDVGIAYKQNENEQPELEPQGGGHYNKVINCVLDSCTRGIYENPVNSLLGPSTNNEYIHCTFKDLGTFWDGTTNPTNNPMDSTNKITNCIIDNGGALDGTFTPTMTNNLIYNTTSMSSFVGTNGNVSTPNPLLDANYQPQNTTFADIDATRVTGVYYDKNGEERANLTTMGAVIHIDESI